MTIEVVNMAKRKHKPIPALTERQIKNFWAKVDKTPGLGPTGECWVWTAKRTKKGYGMFSIRPHIGFFYAHRIAYTLLHGPISQDAWVLHGCHFPSCVRHVKLGTPLENVIDAYRNGTFRPNGRIPMSVETAAEVIKLRNTGMTYREIADALHISISNAHHIYNGYVYMFSIKD
jgi:hypothetical protein